jgi:anti-sigma-K factor RskA
MRTVRVTAGGTATVVMSQAMHTLVLTTAGLPSLPSARSYQLWLVGSAGPRPAGMLPGPHQGMTAPVAAAGLAAGDRVALTVEPAGGSPRPTTAAILTLTL